MLLSFKHSQTSIILRVLIQDSASTSGGGKTGLTSASAGLIISTIADNEASATAYTVAASNVETIATLGTYVAPTSGKCRFKEVDATNHPGVYEIQLANARYAISGAKSLLVSIVGATGACQCDVLIPLTEMDPYAGDNAWPGAMLLGQVYYGDGAVAADVWKFGGTIINAQTGSNAATLFANGGAVSTMTLSNIAPAATALSTATWTGARAALLDNLNVGGLVASAAAMLNISNNTRVRSTIPTFIEVPDSGTESLEMVIELYDATGNMEAPDSTPTIALVDRLGNNLASRLSALSNPSTGRYTFTYTNDTGDALTWLRWTVTVIEGGITRTYSYGTTLVNTTAADFTSSDRSIIQNIESGLTTVQSTLGSPYIGTIADDINRVYTSLPAEPDNAGIASAAASAATAATQATAAATSAASADAKGTTILARLGAWTGTGINTVLGAFRAMAAKLAGLTPTDISTGTTFDNTTDSQEAIRDRGDAAWLTGEGGGGGGSGSGAYTITVTVDDGAATLQGATVRYTEGVNTFTGTTDASGQCTFNLDAATYTVAITKDGYSYAGTSHVVSGSTSATYSMTAIVITAPADPGDCTCYLTTYNDSEIAASGIVVRFRMVDTDDSGGRSFSGTPRNGTSGTDGLLEITLKRGQTYQACRSNGPWVEFTVPDASTYELPDVLGRKQN